MNKPEKIPVSKQANPPKPFTTHGPSYNQAIDDYEKFLPNAPELVEIVRKTYETNSSIALAIAKRLGKQ